MSGTVSGVRTPGRTWAEIDLGAVRHNVRALEHRAPGARLMAVVKADAYGHGAVPVSRAALEAGADAGVVTAEEGAELRRAEIRVPVLVFTDPLPDRLRLAEEYRLIVTAHSLASARRMAARPGLEAHLKVNTGMNRWGVEPSEVGGGAGSWPQLKGVYTHLASADRDEGDAGQISTFDEVLAAHSSGARWCTLRTRLASVAPALQP